MWGLGFRVLAWTVGSYREDLVETKKIGSTGFSGRAGHLGQRVRVRKD